MLTPITPEEFFALAEIRRNALIGPHLIDLETSKEILIRLFAVQKLLDDDTGKRAAKHRTYLNTPHAKLESVIEYDLHLAQDYYPRLYNVHITLTHLLAHELGGVWATFRAWKTNRQPPPDNMLHAEELAWENAMRGKGPYRLIHGEDK